MPSQLQALTAVLADIRRAYDGRADVPPVLEKYLRDPVDVQIDLFAGVARKQWIADAVATAQVMFPAGGWWSAIRRMIEQRHKGPAHGSWWGGVAGGLRAAGWSQTKRRRCDSIKQRNQAIEWYWQPREQQEGTHHVSP